MLLVVSLTHICACVHEYLWHVKMLLLPNRINFVAASECLDGRNQSANSNQLAVCVSYSGEGRGSEAILRLSGKGVRQLSSDVCHWHGSGEWGCV